DLVLSDIGLGDGDGFQLMRAVRQKSQVKAIALSGYGTESDKRASREAGFDAHVTKPVNFDGLLHVIASVCR
ncbi:MAG TPA: response regulator, partial [Polyangiaceae bacterium]